MSGPTADQFRRKLADELREAILRDETTMDVRAGDLHRAVGGYPGTNHAMPVCCSVMRSAMRDGDVVLSEPPKGQGASLTIRYKL